MNYDLKRKNIEMLRGRVEEFGGVNDFDFKWLCKELEEAYQKIEDLNNLVDGLRDGVVCRLCGEVHVRRNL